MGSRDGVTSMWSAHSPFKINFNTYLRLTYTPNVHFRKAKFQNFPGGLPLVLSRLWRLLLAPVALDPILVGPLYMAHDGGANLY